MALDAASFAGAAVLLLPLPSMRPDLAGPAPAVGASLSAAPREIVDALRHAHRRPDLFRAVLAKVPVSLAGGAASS